MAINMSSLLSLVRRVARVVNSSADTSQQPRGRIPRSRSHPRPARSSRSSESRGRAAASYSPSPDGRPDPGEIVWTWVAYEDDPSQGKDRPVLLVARDGDQLLGLMLTSRDHTDARGSRLDSRYVDIGTGAWDRQGRPSEVKVDRLIRVDPASVRREGAVLPRGRFEQVVAALPDGLLD